MTREQEIAWAAGLFEGEGCMSTFRLPHIQRVSLASRDRDVVERFQQIVDAGQIYLRPITTGNPDSFWVWTAATPTASDVMRLFLPYFGERRRTRAEELLATRDAHIERVTAERECPGCGERFRPAFSSNSQRQTHCSSSCYDKWSSRRRYAKEIVA